MWRGGGMRIKFLGYFPLFLLLLILYLKPKIGVAQEKFIIFSTNPFSTEINYLIYKTTKKCKRLERKFKKAKNHKEWKKKLRRYKKKCIYKNVSSIRNGFTRTNNELESTLKKKGLNAEVITYGYFGGIKEETDLFDISEEIYTTIFFAILTLNEEVKQNKIKERNEKKELERSQPESNASEDPDNLEESDDPDNLEDDSEEEEGTGNWEIETNKKLKQFFKQIAQAVTKDNNGEDLLLFSGSEEIGTIPLKAIFTHFYFIDDNKKDKSKKIRLQLYFSDMRNRDSNDLPTLYQDITKWNRWEKNPSAYVNLIYSQLLSIVNKFVNL